MNNFCLGLAIVLLGLPAIGAPTQIFDDAAPVEFTLKAPYSQLMEMVPGFGNPEADIPKVSAEKEPRVSGSISYLVGDVRIELPVTVVMRGNGSKSDCSFPKLKLKIDKRAIANSLFAENKTINLGTHCGDLDGLGGLSDHSSGGRVGDQRGPVREALVYRLQQALELPALRTRVVTINYIDTETNEAFTRKAFFLEDVDGYAKRLQGVREKEWASKWKLGSSTPFHGSDRKKLASLFFFEALVGNEDFNLALPSFKGAHFNPMPEHAIWNAYVLRLPGNQLEFVGYDFDLATIVTGLGFVQSDPPALFIELTGRKGYYEWAIFKTLQMARSYFSKSELDNTISYFLTRRKALEQLIAQDPLLDPDGRQIFNSHLSAFFEILQNQFFVPVTVTEQKKVYTSATKKKFCPGSVAHSSAPLPLGLPLKVLGKKGSLVKVELLDVRNALNGCGDTPVWIEQSPTTDPNYPGD